MTDRKTFFLLYLGFGERQQGAADAGGVSTYCNGGSRVTERYKDARK